MPRDGIFHSWLFLPGAPGTGLWASILAGEDFTEQALPPRNHWTKPPVSWRAGWQVFCGPEWGVATLAALWGHHNGGCGDTTSQPYCEAIWNLQNANMSHSSLRHPKDEGNCPVNTRRGLRLTYLRHGSSALIPGCPPAMLLRVSGPATIVPYPQ